MIDENLDTQKLMIDKSIMKWIFTEGKHHTMRQESESRDQPWNY
jgi:hypothetical protein